MCWGDECPSPGYNGPQIIGGAGGANDPIVFRKQLGNTGFMTDSIVQKNVETAWALSCEVLIKGFDDNFPLTGSVAIETDRRGIIAQSDTFTLKKADTRAVAIDAVIEPNEFASLHWLGVAGFGNVLSGAMLGYGQSGWLDWLDKL